MECNMKEKKIFSKRGILRWFCLFFYLVCLQLQHNYGFVDFCGSEISFIHKLLRFCLHKEFFRYHFQEFFISLFVSVYEYRFRYSSNLYNELLTLIQLITRIVSRKLLAFLLLFTTHKWFCECHLYKILQTLDEMFRK